MRQHRTFWLTSRTRGVNHISQMVGVKFDIRIFRAAFGNLRPVIIKRYELRFYIRQSGSQMRLRNDNRRGCVGEHKRYALGWISRINGHVRCACFENSQNPNRHCQRAFDANRNHHFRACAKRSQGMRQLIRLRVEFRVS